MDCQKRIDYVQYMERYPIGYELLARDKEMSETIDAGQAATEGKKVKPERICSVPGCGKKHLAKGLCYEHYYQKRSEEQALKGGKSGSRRKKASREATPVDNSKVIRIDSHLWGQIEKMAEQELRTPENQLKYMLMRGVREHEDF